MSWAALRWGCTLCLLVSACTKPAPHVPRKQAASPARSEPAPTEPASDRPPVRSDGTVFGESELMGTRVSINVYVGSHRDPAAAKTAMRQALAEMARIESLMSEWQPQTEVSRLNTASGTTPLPVSPELIEVLTRARQISETTEGAFDVTFHAVGQLWSFRTGSHPPSRKHVRTKQRLVNWRNIDIDATQNTVRLVEHGMRIGLGAIAKGYAVDRASDILQAAGFGDHVVEAGGDTYASGTKAGQPWMIGIQDPDGGGTLGALPTIDMAVVTSGNYQRYFEYEGRRYSHILDPRTGWPVPADRSAQSITCVATHATDADAYCTAVAVMGPQEGMSFVERHRALEAVIVGPNGQLHISSGLEDRLVMPPLDPRAP